MEATESPLDVLSRAATMVQDNSPLDVGEESGARRAEDGRPAATQKELPTTRWRRERRGAGGGGGGAATRSRHAPAAPAHPPAHSSAQPSPPARDAPAGFPASSSPPSPEVLVARTAPDTPLDMSTRSRCSPPPYSSHLAPPRPSVITCAPGAATQPSNNSWSRQQNGGSNTGNSNNGSNRQGHRRELLSGMCDPVIDEHFRRSLGKDYLSIFSNEASEADGATDISENNTDRSNSSITVTGLSVDDHFAKALGETWVKLQEQSAGNAAASRPASVPALTRTEKKTAVMTQQQQQPRGLVSI